MEKRARAARRDRDWEDRPQSIDDARSSSSGAMSDSARDVHVPPFAGMKSSGSVGSQESDRGAGESSSLPFKSFAAPHVHASHLVNGETRFPTAMSYVSDAQRSDVATVCSGSVVEDIETESVISQEDQGFATYSPTEKRRPSKTRVVEFAGVSADASRLEVPDPQDSSAQIAVHPMDPPLSRALLLKVAGASLQSGSVKSFGSGGSDDRRAHSDDGTGSLDVDVSRPKGTGSVRSYEGSEGAPETDDGGSLDVETHSVGTRSIHSQDEAVPPEEEQLSATLPPADAPQHTLFHADETMHGGGRQSPGGTIYKGRGTRRYQGRYMHLPLKRFHHNSVHLDVSDEILSNHVTEPRRQQGGNEPWNEGRERRRSRSRSRSPEDEAKPRASDEFRNRKNGNSWDYSNRPNGSR